MKSIKWAAGAASASTGADATSQVITLRPETIGVSIQVAWTGTTAGTVKVQGSNDSLQWDDLTGMSSEASGTPGHEMFVMDTAYWQFLRVVFTHSGGTGFLSGNWNEKGNRK